MKLVFLLLPLICQAVEEEVQQQPIQQDPAQDRFVDLSVDVSYGLPQLGYVYNGLHLRGPRSRKSRQGFSHHVHHNPEATSFQTHYGKDSQKINSNLDFNKEFESLRSKIKRHPTAQLPDVKIVVDSEFEPNADGEEVPQLADDDQEFNVLVEETYNPNGEPEPSYVVPREIGNYEPLEENYEAPVTYGPKPQPEWQKPDQQYSKPPYVAPTNPEPKYHYPSGTKPPLHIKIQQDLQGLVGGVTGLFGSAKPKESTYSAPAYSPSTPKLKIPKLPTLKLPETPYGKPPLMEKIRQDFFSWLPSSDSSSSYAAPDQSYTTPEEYAAPVPEEHYAEPQNIPYQEPQLYGNPAHNIPRQSVFPRENLLNKFAKDINKVNHWVAKQTLDAVQNAPNPLTDLPDLSAGIADLPGLFQKRRKDKNVLQYIPAPNLSRKSNE